MFVALKVKKKIKANVSIGLRKIFLSKSGLSFVNKNHEQIANKSLVL